VRIGVNALYLIPGGVGGTEIYLRSLLQAMADQGGHEILVFLNRETAADPPAGIAVPQEVTAAHRPARLLWEQTVLPVEAARHKVDVLLNPGFTAPLLAPCPQATVFHDLQHKRHPEHFRWFDLPAWRLMLFASACSSEALIAVSQATRRDLLRYYPVGESRVHVIPHGVDERMFALQGRRNTAAPYLLCVSTLHPHKNLERLVRVFARFRLARPEFQLVLCGMRGFHAGAVERLVSEMGLERAVRITGWVDREQVYELYQGAMGFIYPSTFEGFGMPVVEAMAAGLPVACSDIEPLRSIAGGAAELFDPYSEEAMLRAMERLVAEPGRKGVDRARQFRWTEAARATLEVLASLAGKNIRSISP
jgi:glycosyltransferase involved in cell wall biosynthesis